jgi:16S rRNA (guanine966-N2)-methyltransferase
MQQATNKRRNSVRIIAGQYRSRKLTFPALEGLRPTADRVRETLFNWLQETIQGETCLDLFAGSGALGFEALSRGAKFVDFVEKNKVAADAVRGNIKLLEIKQAAAYCGDAIQWLRNQTTNTGQYGLVFLDPPFNENLLTGIVAELENSKLLKNNGLIYIESEFSQDQIALPDTWTLQKNKRAGSVHYGLYRVREK